MGAVLVGVLSSKFEIDLVNNVFEGVSTEAKAGLLVKGGVEDLNGIGKIPDPV